MQQQPGLRPQLGTMPLREIVRERIARDHQIDAHASVLLAHQGEKSRLQVAAIEALGVNRVTVDVDGALGSGVQRPSQRLVVLHDGREQVIAAVQHHDSPGRRGVIFSECIRAAHGDERMRQRTRTAAHPLAHQRRARPGIARGETDFLHVVVRGHSPAPVTTYR